MKIKAKEVKKNNMIKVAGKSFTVINVEISDIGKQGTKKVRLECRDDAGEKLVLIRPEEFPIEVV